MRLREIYAIARPAILPFAVLNGIFLLAVWWELPAAVPLWASIPTCAWAVWRGEQRRQAEEQPE